MSDKSTSYDSVAAVGILQVDSRMLVIKRSQTVIAPGKICFPGGRLEDDELVVEALQREFLEELNLSINPVKELWVSITAWKCKVHWWSVDASTLSDLIANQEEVASVHWNSAHELLQCEDLLESNREFLELVGDGEIDLM